MSEVEVFSEVAAEHLNATCFVEHCLAEEAGHSSDAVDTKYGGQKIHSGMLSSKVYLKNRM